MKKVICLLLFTLSAFAQVEADPTIGIKVTQVDSRAITYYEPDDFAQYTVVVEDYLNNRSVSFHGIGPLQLVKNRLEFSPPVGEYLPEASIATSIEVRNDGYIIVTELYFKGEVVLSKYKSVPN